MFVELVGTDNVTYCAVRHEVGRQLGDGHANLLEDVGGNTYKGAHISMTTTGTTNTHCAGCWISNI
jgi:hypothetical protein